MQRYNEHVRRWLAVAALGAAFLALPAWGQRRGGVSGGFAGHAGFVARGTAVAGHGPVMGNRSPGFVGVQRSGLHFRTSSNQPFGSPFFFHHRPRVFPRWPYYWYGSYYWAPYYSYPGYYRDDSYATDYQSYPASDYSSGYVQSSQVEQDEINRLNDEVERLREERETRATLPSAARSKTESQATELVFRDKHTEEVQNYAIVRQMFWVFSEQRTRKIPLADLDLATTKRANEDRGVEFQLPE